MLRRPAADHTICPSCGTQFGYSDAGPAPLPRIRAELRNRWIRKGPQWHSRVVAAPLGWDPLLQLRRAGMDYENPWNPNIQITSLQTYVKAGDHRQNFGSQQDFYNLKYARVRAA